MGIPQKPMVSREDYDRARAVLDALPAGYYVKCVGCSGWYTGGKFTIFPGASGPTCERCATMPGYDPAKRDLPERPKAAIWAEFL